MLFRKSILKHSSKECVYEGTISKQHTLKSKFTKKKKTKLAELYIELLY